MNIIVKRCTQRWIRKGDQAMLQACPRATAVSKLQYDSLNLLLLNVIISG